jgi:hypothetical protein
MQRNKSFLLLILLTVFSLTSCNLHKPPPPGGGGGGATATLAMTMVTDTAPASPSILSFKVTVTGILLTPTTGTPQTITLNPAPTIELMRLQSDSAFLGTFTNVNATTYSSVTISVGNPQITFLNNTTGTITNASANCVVGAICTLSSNATGNIQITTAPFPLTVATNTVIGLGFDLNLSNAITITSGMLTVNLQNTATNNVLSAFTLPRNTNLATGQLALIEDFTGVVSINGQAVTLASPTRGNLTATATLTSVFDSNPDVNNVLCTSPGTFSSCVKASQVASVDAILNKDGTLSIQEYEPLLATSEDIIEGTVASINSTVLSQFTLATTDKIQAAQNSLIGGVNVGDQITINLLTPNPFLVDVKGLLVPPGNVGLFAGATNNTVLRLGQTVAVHATSFTAASGTTLALVTADTVILRWSRFTSTVATTLTPSTFTITGFPAYFNLAGTTNLEVQIFTGTPGVDGVTNLDGITDATGLSANAPVALRALYIQNATNSSQFAFFAAKVRKP